MRWWIWSGTLAVINAINRSQPMAQPSKAKANRDDIWNPGCPHERTTGVYSIDGRKVVSVYTVRPDGKQSEKKYKITVSIEEVTSDVVESVPMDLPERGGNDDDHRHDNDQAARELVTKGESRGNYSEGHGDGNHEDQPRDSDQSGASLR